jgi:hypothetical protein
MRLGLLSNEMRYVTISALRGANGPLMPVVGGPELPSL